MLFTGQYDTKRNVKIPNVTGFTKTYSYFYCREFIESHPLEAYEPFPFPF